MQESIEFLKELIAIDTINPPGDEEQAARAIAAKLEEYGIEVKLDPLEPKRANLIARLKGTGKKRSLIFSGHMDVVPLGDIPWQYQPFAATEIDGKLYGRGTSDMKGGLAALTMAMIEIAKSGVQLANDLVLIATAGEEVNCLGSTKLAGDGVLNGAGAVLIGEPSNGELFIAHKGLLWLEVIAYGKTAHGSMPEQGINAIDAMYEIMKKLQNFRFQYDEHPLLGTPTRNIAAIAGGIKTNMVPDVCRLQIDIRTVPGQDHQELITQVKTLLKEVESTTQAKLELNILNDLVSVSTSGEHPFVKLALNTAEELFKREFKPKGIRYCTDASKFVHALDNDVPILICGPGLETLAHQPNEYIEISKYIDAVKFYQELALRYSAE